MIKLFFGLFILGLSFGCGPCLVSCGPVLISYVAGTKMNMPGGIKAYFLFSLARIAAYLVLSLVVFSLGRLVLDRWLASFSRYILIGAGSFIVLLGLPLVLGILPNIKGRIPKLNFLNFFTKKIHQPDKKNSFVLGIFFGFLPCAPLIAVLSYIGLIAKNIFQALWYALTFGIGTFVSPLIIMVMIAGFMRSMIPRILQGREEVYQRILPAVCGAIIIFLGVQLIIRGF